MTARIEWIGVRPERKGSVESITTADVSQENGIDGDHPSKDHRRVTIISKEHLEEVRDTLGASSIDPAAARRNIMISGLDFDDLKERRIAHWRGHH